jgi:uncharacterized protein (DUF302 family)
MRRFHQILLFLALGLLTLASHAAEPALLTRFVPGRHLDQVTASLIQAIASNNYTFVRQQAIDNRLVPQDWEAKSVRIVYFCNFAKMDAALKLDVRTTQAMPCRITLIERSEGVEMIAVNPAWTSEGWDAPAAHAFCLDLKADYQAILEEASL